MMNIINAEIKFVPAALIMCDFKSQIDKFCLVTQKHDNTTPNIGNFEDAKRFLKLNDNKGFYVSSTLCAPDDLKFLSFEENGDTWSVCSRNLIGFDPLQWS